MIENVINSNQCIHVGIAVCTWNRACVLDRTLGDLCKLTIPAGVNLKVIVVNNNCTDETEQVVASYSNLLPVSSVFESKPGLSNARNCAIGAFDGDVLIFIDDDIFVENDWLTEYVNAFKEYPDADFFGGSLDLEFEVPPPRWLSQLLEQLSNTFGKHDFGPEVRRLNNDEYPLGGNMAFRKSVLENFSFDPNLGRSAGGLLGGEEVCFVDMLRESGHRGVAVGTARGLHFVPEERISAKFIWEWHHGCGKTLARTISNESCAMFLGTPRWAVGMYLRSSVVAWCFSVFRNQYWLNAFTDAAKAKGIIDGFTE